MRSNWTGKCARQTCSDRRRSHFDPSVSRCGCCSAQRSGGRTLARLLARTRTRPIGDCITPRTYLRLTVARGAFQHLLLKSDDSVAAAARAASRARTNKRALLPSETRQRCKAASSPLSTSIALLLHHNHRPASSRHPFRSPSQTRLTSDPAPDAGSGGSYPFPALSSPLPDVHVNEHIQHPTRITTPHASQQDSGA